MISGDTRKQILALNRQSSIEEVKSLMEIAKKEIQGGK